MNEHVSTPERLERLEAHQREFKKDLSYVSDDIKAIKTAVIGNEFNNHLGLVQMVSKQGNEITDLKHIISEHKIYFKQIAWAIGVLSTALLALIVKMISV